MRDRRGFALVSALWLVLILSWLLLAGCRSIELSIRAAENRIAGTRAIWAARACLAMARARYAPPRDQVLIDLPDIDSLAIGPTTWCGSASADPASRVHPNAVDSTGLVRVLKDPRMAASLLDWIDADDLPRDAGAEAPWYDAHGRRPPSNAPVRDVREMAYVRGFEGWTQEALDSLFTTRGNGAISPNSAPIEVLRSVGLLPPGGAELVYARRATGGLFHELDEIAEVAGMTLTVDGFTALTGRLELFPATTVIGFSGHSQAGARTTTSQLMATIARTGAGLSVRRLEVR